MSVVGRLTFLTCVLLILNAISSTPVSKKVNEKPKEESSDSTDGESSEKELGTVPPKEIEKLKEEIIEKQEEDAEKFGLPLTSKPEEIETFLKEEEKEYGEELPEKVEEALADDDDELKNFVHFLTLFYKIEAEASEKEEEEVVKTPEEMKKMKEEIFILLNELNKREGLPEVSHEKFDTFWNKKKKESGKLFPGRVEKLLILLKEIVEKNVSTIAETTTLEISEAVTVTSTQSADIVKEESPKSAFTLRNAKGEICILAKFQSSILLTFPGKSSEQKVEVTIPHNGHTKGKCRGPNGSSLLQIAWGKFIFSLFFNKTTEDTWGVTLVELTYDTSGPLFDGAAEREKVTIKSKNVSLFETPFGKSYFCPAQEVIFLYREDRHVATVRLKEIHLQPYDVEDGTFSQAHRCNQVVIGGPDEEPFIQDETVPLAVGCTLAIITLLILVGFSVHRAYNAAKVDYNTME